ncbi:MAG: FGGY-family carbohydrate kinase [Chloroflexi bacterium]|nr:FGGY-family carbohydrate kinase [Chloroflexota bacterium]
MSNLLLGIDVGTYSSKGVLVEADGTVLKTHIVEHKMDIPQQGWAEQDADNVWWADVVSICKVLLDGSPYSGEDVAGVALSAIGPCVLPLNSAGKALRPGILYGVDTRASDEIIYLNNKLGEEAIYDFSGMTLSSQAAGPKILWIKNNEPDIWKKTTHLTTASSYLVFKMTGEKVMDRHTASHYMPLMDINTLEWSDRFADEIVNTEKLPRLGWSDEIAGQVNKAGAEETGLKTGTLVAVGAVDALSEGISVGVTKPGDLMIMYGSTAFFILVLDNPVPDQRMWTVGGAFDGQYNLAAGMATTGSLTRWFKDELAADLSEEKAYQTLFNDAETISPGANGLIVLPYFSGERTPINDPKARGMIAGLTLSHSRKHLFRAVLEGVGYGIRHNIETFQKIGAPVQRIVAVGGGTKSTTWLQIVSDIVGIEQEIPAQTIGASYGDAFLAGLATGVLKKEDLNTWVKPEKIITPNMGQKKKYSHYYENYLALYQQTRGIMHRLADEA